MNLNVEETTGYLAQEWAIPLVKWKCFKLQYEGTGKVEFVTPLVLRYRLGVPQGYALDDQGSSFIFQPRTIQPPFSYTWAIWERVPGGATVEEMALWNLRGHQ